MPAGPIAGMPSRIARTSNRAAHGRPCCWYGHSARSRIGSVLGELVKHAAVGTVNFDAVESGGDRIGGGATEIHDDAGDFGKLERATARHARLSQSGRRG